MRKLIEISMLANVIFLTALPAMAQEIDIWNGIYTEAQATRGQSDYSARCASCHAVDLRGNSNTPSLLGMSFMFIWEGQTLADLYNKMRDDMPSDNPASLSKTSYESLLAFLLQANSFPAGSQALNADSTLLEKIEIRAQTINN